MRISVRRIYVSFASGYPYQNTFLQISDNLNRVYLRRSWYQKRLRTSSHRDRSVHIFLGNAFLICWKLISTRTGSPDSLFDMHQSLRVENRFKSTNFCKTLRIIQTYEKWGLGECVRRWGSTELCPVGWRPTKPTDRKSGLSIFC